MVSKSRFPFITAIAWLTFLLKKRNKKAKLKCLCSEITYLDLKTN